MRRIVDLHPGTAKTDARDAYVIADAARTLPHTLRRVDTGDEALAELEVLVGYDDDLAVRPPASATASAACSPGSTLPWNASSARKSRILPCCNCCRAAAARPDCAKPAAASCISLLLARRA